MIDPLTPMLLVVFSAVIYCWHLYKVRGHRDLRILIAVFMPIAIIIEFIGVYSGAYEYIWRNYLLNSIFVAFGWISNIYPNMHVAMMLIEGKNYYRKKTIPIRRNIMIGFLTGIFAVLYDLFLDPIAVHLGIWTWNVPTHWYGAPLGNFIGWWLIAFSSTSTYILLAYPNRKYRLELWIPIMVIIDIVFIVLMLGVFGQILTLMLAGP